MRSGGWRWAQGQCCFRLLQESTIREKSYFLVFLRQPASGNVELMRDYRTWITLDFDTNLKIQKYLTKPVYF